jgi:hypothetical protein
VATSKHRQEQRPAAGREGVREFANSMRLVLLVGAPFFLSIAHAAQIYGTLTENGRAAAGLQIIVRCADESAFQAQTSESGSYSVRIDSAGYCTFIVSNRPGQPSLEIYLYDQPSRYDFNLIPNQDGSYTLSKM